MAAVAHDEQRRPRVLADDGGIGHGEHRRRIDNDEVVAPRECFEQVAETLAHQQLGRMRGQRTLRQHVEAGQHFALDYARRIGAAQHVGKSRLVPHAEVRMHLAAPHVAVDHEHALARRGNERSQIDGEERLTRIGARARQHHDVVGRLIERELQRRTQASHAFHRDVLRRLRGEHVQALPAHHHVLLQAKLQAAARHHREHGYADRALDLVGTLDATVERLLHECTNDADEEAAAEADENHDETLRPDRLVRRLREIDDAHVADLPRLHDAQLLRAVQQIRVELRVDAHVAQQAQGGLLSVWQRLDALRHLSLRALQLRDLGIERLHRRVIRRESLRQIGTLSLQVGELRLVVDHLLQQQAAFLAEVDGAVLVAEVVVALLRRVELMAQLRQLLVEERERALGFRHAAVGVLLDELTCDAVYHVGRQLRVLPLQRDADDARLQRRFAHAQRLLKPLHRVERRRASKLELRARAARELIDVNDHRTRGRYAAHVLADAAARNRDAVGIVERERAVGPRRQRERLAIGRLRRVEARHRYLLVTPCEAAQIHERLYFEAPLARRQPREQRSDDRQFARFGGNVEM